MFSLLKFVHDVWPPRHSRVVIRVESRGRWSCIFSYIVLLVHPRQLRVVPNPKRIRWNGRRMSLGLKFVSVSCSEYQIGGKTWRSMEYFQHFDILTMTTRKQTCDCQSLWSQQSGHPVGSHRKKRPRISERVRHPQIPTQRHKPHQQDHA